ncbi:MAG TPA: ABC transporter permease [Candidatus Anaerotruncus excrementipullorum]|uniref:ABC transporter permease n=1 Tax=Candidatus Anaerotruncus excrementipullorum TaxID=2838465 RepID=A0A9D1WQM3_9FIRM|nr:ABC transporter permease [Candidatus Anaerotruncus excrementipullorum]
MSKYILKRLLIAIPTFFGITILVYLISSMAPGSPLEMLLADPMATVEDMEALEHQLGLDQPVIIQYLKWLGSMLQGNLGISYRTGQPVWGMVMERLGPTLILTFASTIVAILVAVPLGIMSAYKPYSAWDYISSGLSFIGASTPTFFTGLVFIYLFAVKLQILPMGGMYDSGTRSLSSLLTHIIMPCMVLAIFNIGSLLRQTRGSMMEVFQEDYIRTARAKGLGEFIVVMGHALRNALIPVVTVLSTMIPFLFGGAVVAEQVFGWPGLGSLMVQSINSRDYPTIMGITVIIAIAVLLGNVVTDILYGVLDPKIRQSR